MFNSFLHTIKSARRGTHSLSKADIAACRQLAIKDPHFKINYANYIKYRMAVGWDDKFLHPCYLQLATNKLVDKLLGHKRSPFGSASLQHAHNFIAQEPTIDRAKSFAVDCRFGNIYALPNGIMLEVITTGRQENRQVYEAVSSYWCNCESQKTMSLPQAKHLPLVNQSGQTSRRDLQQTDINIQHTRNFASIAHSYHPRHLSQLSALLCGYGNAVLQNMFSLALALSKEESKLAFEPSDQVIVVKADFYHPIHLPARLGLQSAPQKMDRLIFVSDAGAPKEDKLVIQYCRGEAARLHKGR